MASITTKPRVGSRRRVDEKKKKKRGRWDRQEGLADDERGHDTHDASYFTVIIGSSYGAGTYGMSGCVFGSRFTFLWLTAKTAVTGPEQIAGVMSQVRRAQAARKGAEFDEAEDAAIVAAVEAVQEAGSLAVVATGAVSDDGIIDPRDTRTVLGLCLSVVRNRPIEGADGVRGVPAVSRDSGWAKADAFSPAAELVGWLRKASAADAVPGSTLSCRRFCAV